MKVLVIEEGFKDSPDVEAILQQDHELLKASTVEKGLHFIQEERPDMVFWGANLSEEKTEVVIKTLSLFMN